MRLVCYAFADVIARTLTSFDIHYGLKKKFIADILQYFHPVQLLVSFLLKQFFLILALPDDLSNI